MKVKHKGNDNSFRGPRVLILDIETAPILACVWKIWDECVGLNQIKQDWHVLSWAARWIDDPAGEVMYRDQRNAKKLEDDKALITPLWHLLDEADVVVTQNGVSFDIRKLNARFILNGMQPPSSYKNVDTLLIAKRRFSFTSNKLEYMTDKLCTKYKKLKHHEYPGFDLWAAVLAGDRKAWRVMEKYNKHDVLSLEELYKKLMPWDNSVNYNLYDSEEGSPVHRCACGSTEFKKRGFFYSPTGKFQRYRCLGCGAETRSRKNLFSTERKKHIRVRTAR